jgi:hypothetical protein
MESACPLEKVKRFAEFVGEFFAGIQQAANEEFFIWVGGVCTSFPNVGSKVWRTSFSVFSFLSLSPLTHSPNLSNQQ